jgi:hypothetical protein
MSEEQKLEIGKDLLTLAQLSKYLAEKNLGQQDWSGLPVPVMGLNLVLEPRYKHKCLSDFQWKEFYDQEGIRHPIDEPAQQEASEFSTVNSWWNSQYKVTIVVVKDKLGRAQSRVLFEDKDKLSITLRTLEAAAAWPVDAEQKAQKKLAGLIPAELFELYLLTGHFLETSSRSQLTYLFRKGRPTIVLREVEEGWYGLCALCLHPIGYYGDTWAGVMCPTDEVIAHLLMMRGSEEKFWANANQHPLDHPAAGV